LEIPELIRLARRVEQVHEHDPDCPSGLADHLENMYQELENQILFAKPGHGDDNCCGGCQ